MGIDRAEKRSRIDNGRDGGGFIAFPHAVMNSAAYLGLSANARSLLLEIALQFGGGDNGRMLLSRAHLAKRGWNSSDMIAKGKRELLDAELIFETVKGQRPNKASWYAVTWRKLDKIKGFDQGAEKAFERGAYSKRTAIPKPKETLDRTQPNGGRQNTVLNPLSGVEQASIGPLCGTETRLSVPPHGANRALSVTLPRPPHGHPLEMPSIGVLSGAAVRTLAMVARGMA